MLSQELQTFLGELSGLSQWFHHLAWWIQSGANHLPIELPVKVEDTKPVIKLAVKVHPVGETAKVSTSPIHPSDVISVKIMSPGNDGSLKSTVKIVESTFVVAIVKPLGNVHEYVLPTTLPVTE